MNLSKCDRINFIGNEEFCLANFKTKPKPVSRATAVEPQVIEIDEVMGTIEKTINGEVE